MAVTVLTLLKRAADTDEDGFRRHWQGPHAELVLRLPGLRRYTQAAPHADARHPQAFDGVAAVDFDDLDAVRLSARSQAFEAVRADESRFVDPAASVTLVVERHEVNAPAPPSEGAVKFMGFMRRRAGLDRAAFRAHWRDRHAALATRLPGLLGYVHCVPVALGDRPGSAPPYDGAAELWFPTVADLRAAFRTDAGAAVRRDEEAFVDPERSFALQLEERRLL